MKRISLLLSAFTLCAGIAVAGDDFATLRGAALDMEPTPPKISRVEDDAKRKRNYPMQPPTIPHTVAGYQVDINVNRCMACHSRRQTGQSQAPMVSVTHYMDRDGNFLAEISPRRYFCEQCHVVQTLANPLVGNDFVDIDEILLNRPAAGH